MKHFIVIFILFLSSYILANNNNLIWKKIAVGINGHVFYVDTNSIKNNKGFLEFWQLIDYTKYDEYMDLSAKINIKVDCFNKSLMWLKVSYHKESMGTDHVDANITSNTVSGWQYPLYNSPSRLVLDYVCENNNIAI